MIKHANIVFGLDGNQYTAHFDEFLNLQESPCGFGDTPEEAVKHLYEQVNNA